MSGNEPTKLSFTATLLLGAGVIVLVAGVATLARERASGGWLAIPGQVHSSRVAEETSSRTNAASGRTVTRTRYRAAIEYTYRVSGNELTGTRVSLADTAYLQRADAAVIVDRYPLGAEVTVYYDPSNVGETVLEIGSTGTGSNAIGLGLLLLLAAGIMELVSRFGSP